MHPAASIHSMLVYAPPPILLPLLSLRLPSMLGVSEPLIYLSFTAEEAL